MLAGKQLLLEELSSDLRRELSDLKRGEVVCVQGITKNTSKYICQRWKYRAAAICIILCKGAVKHARIAGSVSRWGELVNVLYLFAGFMKETETGAKSITVEWGFIDWSELAAQGVIEAIKQKESFYLGCVRGWKNRNVILRYRRGAPKKEKRVCIATPRTDVVLELAPRLQEVFPSITVAALYGGSVDHKKMQR